MSKVAFFGGTFDPIHNGHLNLARTVIEQRRADEVVFVPAGYPAHKSHVRTSPEQRLEMVKLAVDDQPGFGWTDLEYRTRDPSYTYKTVEVLHWAYPYDELFLLIGMDSLCTLHTWDRAKSFVERINFITYPRPGMSPPSWEELSIRFSESTATKLLDSIMSFEGMETSNISSTAIREAASNGEDLRRFVPESVAWYITENNLYKE